MELFVASMGADPSACPACGEGVLRRVISRVNARGADAGVSRDQLPTSWYGTNSGDRETIRYWHKKTVEREKVEAKHPELAGDRRPVLAHEGRFADAPLRAGDPIPNVG